MKTKQKTVKADKEISQGLVPKLRFPEFWDAGEWEEKPLGHICKFVRGPFGGSLKKDIFVEDGFAVYEQSQAIYQRFNTFRYFITEEKFNELKRFSVQSNDIIMSCSGTMGKFAIVPKGSKSGVINQALLKLTVKNGLDTRFIKTTLELPINQEKLLSQSAGGAIKNVVSVSQIKEITIHMPVFPEQQKIADCLSSIDELIAAQAQKLDTLKAHKKGLMQQLFPAEGETVPKLRFPEFRNAGAWEEKTLEQVANYENGKAHEKHIDEAGKYVVVNSKFISTEGDVKKFTKKAFCFANKKDVLMVLSDVPNGKAIAKCYFVESNNLYAVNQRICKLKPKNIVAKLLFYILDRNPFFLAFDDGVKQTNLRKDDVLDCPILLPSSPDEQQKIAECLASIDKLITAQAQKLDTLNDHKKGLMQQLFPSTDKVN